MNQVLAVFSWYLVSLVIGLAGFLISYRLLDRLPGRGFGLSRAVGLLALGTVVWWGGTSGALPNTRAGNLAALLIVLAFGLWLNRDRLSELRAWFTKNQSQAILVELLFLISFGFWAFIRANAPEIIGTEKPMELAFLKAITSSQQFPPPDPWLAGFGISYYYFGFVLAGILTQLTGVLPAVAFNLSSAFWFALVVIGAYSLGYNLISARAKRPVLTWPLLGPLFIVITGNLVGFLEVLHARHLFWRTGPDGGMTSGFWRWLDIKTLVNPPMGDPTWIPDRHWWWWRASRVVRDLNLAGVDHEVIDEFPFFSFLLADIHPHVLAMPFALLAVAFVFQVLRSPGLKPMPPLVRLSDDRWRWLTIGLNTLLGLTVLAAGLSNIGGEIGSDIIRLAIVTGLSLGALNFLLRLIRGQLPLKLGWADLIAGAWIFGAMAFLNTWDFPIYLSLLFFALLLDEDGLRWRKNLISAMSSSAAILILGVLLFLPWYPSFASQAGGVLPNLGFPTKIQQFFVMFGPLFVPILVWLIWRSRDNWKEKIGPWLAFAIGLPLALWLAAWILAGVLSLAAGPTAIGAALDLLGVSSTDQGIRAALGRRLAHPWTGLLMGLTLGLVWTLLRPKSTQDSADQGAEIASQPAKFSGLLIATGALLVLGPEFLYLKDLFGTRMNTIFKFYFATWILWGVAATYVVYEYRPRATNQLARLLIILPLILGLFYPVMGLITRTNGFDRMDSLTLNGAAYLRDSFPADAQAIDWINERGLDGVVAEAVGGSYSQYARISTHTPLRTVLGWEFHEIQWRGSAEPQGSRKADIERLYRTSDWQEARSVVEQYDIDFVYIGPLERSSYGSIRVDKFEAFMEPIYQQGDVVIYAMPEKTVSQ